MSLRKKFVNSTLVNKICTKCGETFPRDNQHFYNVRVNKWDSFCITCRNEQSNKWKKQNKGRKAEIRLKYLKTDKGYFGEMFNQMKKSRYYDESEFPDTETLIKHWHQQKEKTGFICPGTGVTMTMIKGRGIYNKCLTNISKDRLLPWQNYTKQNTIFVAWKFNNDKKAITPKQATSYLKLVEERFNTVDLEEEPKI
jgi:hypothetical protein